MNFFFVSSLFFFSSCVLYRKDFRTQGAAALQSMEDQVPTPHHPPHGKIPNHAEKIFEGMRFLSPAFMPRQATKVLRATSQGCFFCFFFVFDSRIIFSPGSIQAWAEWGVITYTHSTGHGVLGFLLFTPNFDSTIRLWMYCTSSDRLLPTSGCNECFFESLLPFYHLETIWSIASDLQHLASARYSGPEYCRPLGTFSFLDDPRDDCAWKSQNITSLLV